MTERISTGIEGFDKLIEGGVPKGHLVLVAGTPGTGKSIFCAQVAYHNALKGKKCLYLNLEQDGGRLEHQMKQFGWDTSKVEKNFRVVGVDSTNPNLVDYILQEVKRLTHDIIVLDSLDSISSVPMNPKDVSDLGIEKVHESLIPTVIDQPNIGRMKLKQIFNAISESGATALLTSERVENAPGITRDTISEFLCDGIILFKALAVGKTFNRTVQVVKMRQTEADCGINGFSITKSGVTLE